MAIFKGYGLIWDREQNKPIAKFVKGKFETEDKRTIEILKTFPNVELISEEIKKEIVIDEIQEEKLSRKELISLAKDKGIKGADRMKVSEIEELLSEL